MPTAAAILAELERKGSERTRTLLARHGNDPGRAFGVSIADLKAIAKTLRKQQALACELYGSGNLDAMYLAGLVADGAQLTEDQLTGWAQAAAGLQMISEYPVPWLAVEHPRGRELALEWISSPLEHMAASGWCTYSGIVATKPDAELPLDEIAGLLARVEREIHHAPNRVRNAMNGFVISAGCYVAPLSEQAIAAAGRIGPVFVDMGETACKVPLAATYIEKVKSLGRLGKKRKTMRC